ncbi:MAG: hypothetical protein M1818_007499 [Claussenomyces sp. TS43310]|nr:MAG: hypothetical protein M1818_007499 [Claussenomyces sp. TS43310]
MSEIATDCPFCRIGAHGAPSPPSSARARSINPSADSLLSKPDLTSPPTFLVLSTDLCLAFLDIMPLSPGHLLVTTRRHRSMISDVTEDESRELGFWLPVLSRVVAAVTETDAWNIVQNNGAAAAQVVPHIHFHIIPRPALTPELRNRSFTMFGRGQRTDLDDAEAVVIAQKLRLELAAELERVRVIRDQEAKGKL